MIAQLRGLLVEKDFTRAIVDVQGVGYDLQIPMSTYDRLPRLNEEVTLRTHLHVREDALVLFGFSTDRERLLFLLLTSVSGVGPKLAINALSAMTVEQFAQAVRDGDVKSLSKISGVGKRSAERLTVELRDKLGDVAPAVAAGAKAGDADASPAAAARNAAATDATAALVQLGFKQDQVQTVVRELLDAMDGEPVSAQDLIRRGLAKIRG